MYEVKLKNSDEKVLIDEKVHKFLTTDSKMKKLDIINRLRRHSSGCAVFQKTKPTKDGSFKIETYYLHKLVAEKFKKSDRTKVKNLVGTVNGNKLDCRIENVEWRSRSTASRKRKSSSSAGYTGVYKENHRYRAVISKDRRSMHIGMFATAEEAAMAYNKISRELYGDEGKINIIRKGE